MRENLLAWASISALAWVIDSCALLQDSGAYDSPPAALASSMAAWADCISACGGLAQATATRAAASTRLRYTLRFDMVRASPVGEMTDRRGLHRETSMSRWAQASTCSLRPQNAPPGARRRGRGAP